jgi:hypothetical protein
MSPRTIRPITDTLAQVVSRPSSASWRHLLPLACFLAVALLSCGSNEDDEAAPNQTTATDSQWERHLTNERAEEVPTVVTPSPRCLAAFAGVADYDSAEYQDTYLATVDACEDPTQWAAALRRYPQAAGLRPDAPDEAFSRDMEVVCAYRTSSPMCVRAKSTGMIDGKV